MPAVFAMPSSSFNALLARLFIAWVIWCAGFQSFPPVHGQEDIRAVWRKIIQEEHSVYPERGKRAPVALLRLTILSKQEIAEETT